MMRTRSWKRIGLSVLIVALAAACRSPVDRPPRISPRTDEWEFDDDIF